MQAPDQHYDRATSPTNTHCPTSSEKLYENLHNRQKTRTNGFYASYKHYNNRSYIGYR